MNNIQHNKTPFPRLLLFVLPQLVVIGGVDKYQALCRRCYGGLMEESGACVALRGETP